MVSRSKLLRPIIFAITLLAIAIGAWQSITYLQHRGLVKIEVHAIPEDSQVQLDGKDAPNGTLYVKPGIHTLHATREYFSAVTKKIDTHDLKPSQVIYLLPFPSSQKALDYLTQHPEIQKEREQQAAIDTANTQRELAKKYPILSKLPAYNSDYRIDYSIDAVDTISFSITLYPIVNGPSRGGYYQQQLKQYKGEALQFLRSNGIDPDKFNVTYSPSTASNL